ncbi:MAG: M36 family metallopeptidase, partial [Bryobacteraceae bacterium]
MQRCFFWFVVCAVTIAAQQQPAVPSAMARKMAVANHIFRLRGALTEPSPLTPREVALGYLRKLAPAYGLSNDDLATAYAAKEFRTESNGVTHLIFHQKFDGADVENAVWVANVDRDGRLLNVGGRLYPRPPAAWYLPDSSRSIAAVRAAAQAVNPKLAAGYSPFAKAAAERTVRYAQDNFGADLEGRAAWFAVNGSVYPVWRFRVVDAGGHRAYAVMIESRTNRVLAKNPVTFFQNPPPPPRGLVYDRNPQPDAAPGVLSTTPPPFVDRVLRSFAGDPVASPKGWVIGAETAGNNVVAGTNPSGVECAPGPVPCPLRPATSVAANLDFSFPLQVGASAPAPSTFPGAAVTNLFYWANRAHDLYYALGFDEAAGNFQDNNFGHPGAANDAVYAYAQDADALEGGAALDNSDFGATLGTFADVTEDGVRPRLAMFVSRFGGVFTDPDLDAETILHEYTHGVTLRLVQQLYTTAQGAAMGEAWSDFFALEFLTPQGAPPDGGYDFGAYFSQAFGNGIRPYPYSTNFNINPLTYADLGHVIYRPEAHADGCIWVEALWQARAALIQQFGDREGRRRMRQLSIDSMTMSPPAPSMVDARDAFLLAEQVDYNGASQSGLWAAFAKRGLGALAQSGTGDSIHISPSFDVPSTTASLGFYESSYVIGESVRVVLSDPNLTASTAHVQLTSSSGDIENLQLQQTGMIYTGSIFTDYAPVGRGDGLLELAPGDSISAYYVDLGNPSGAALIQKNVKAYPDYFQTFAPPAKLQFDGEKPLGLRGEPTANMLRALPFPFPFFGQNYTAIWVYNNGILTFDLPDFSPCGDLPSLSLLKAVAPMWMQLRTDGAIQPKEDVYVSQTDNSVTFHWVAETSADIEFLKPPSPVNFAATLFNDGRIEFQYGDGNRDLVSGSQLFGCPAQPPTVGISNGHETFAEPVVTHDSQGSLQTALGVTLEPGFVPHGGAYLTLETPADGDTVQGLLSGTGLVYDSEPDNEIRRVDVIVDGVARAPASLHAPKTLFCAANPVNGCPFIGFTFTLSTAFEGITPGKHTLQLRATNSRGVITVAPDQPLTFTVQGGDAAPYASITAPADGDTVSGIVPVTGYFALPDALLRGVDVILDGLSYGAARYGLNQQSVCAALPGNPPNCPRIGFSFNLDTTAENQTGKILVGNGPHSLQVRATDVYGRTFTAPPKPAAITVNNPVHPKPVALITAPAANQTVGGVLHVSGYAYDSGGTVVTVSLMIDGYRYNNPVAYGTPAPDVCAALPNVTACPNIGFSVDFDSTRLSNGPHTLSILVKD